ncbi:MAG: DUF4194 domain-containing protein [Actinomycetia bacterium]|nr:DUF4194 domain-containing protein [Actinomycetes bacterium]MCP5033127.1 DUF4194 domain-containing protein [Actinomycetes bacterium]
MAIEGNTSRIDEISAEHVEPGTAEAVKRSVQELMKLGVLYAETKPKLYRTVLASRDEIATILEPLDLVMRVDEVRGLAVLALSPLVTEPTEERPEPTDWSHPLVRRQRLTLAQSLLVALLRRHYVDYERTGSTLAPLKIAVEDLITELQPYLGDAGSEAEELTRARRLLDQLKDHGIVSGIEEDQVTVRPLICHLADIESLKTLLEHYKNLTNSASLPGPGPEAGDGDGAGSDSDESRPDLDLAGLALSTEPARRSEVRQ